MRNLEEQFHVACANFLSVKYPPRKYLWYHVPNGGLRNVIVATKLKRMGTRRGVPDILIDEPRGVYHGLRIELKAGKGRATPEQKELFKMFGERGYLVAIINNIDDFMNVVNAYMKDGSCLSSPHLYPNLQD